MAIGKYQRQTSTDLNTSEGLYQLSQQQGGLVAQRAAELTKKEPTIGQRIGGVLGGAFKGLVDVLNIGSYSVGSALSGKPVSSRTTPSDVLFKGAKATDPFSALGLGVGKFALDVILDPLTYVGVGLIGKG